ncbi:hypothetical protein Tco_1003598 [Tanacetum coccineum]|uniref:Uncharacterized protein n=1 Tax=Tanacetum coccineum TaxID=301880 RepID=A0ABQ5F9V7_9ASTR
MYGLKVRRGMAEQDIGGFNIHYNNEEKIRHVGFCSVDYGEQKLRGIRIRTHLLKITRKEINSDGDVFVDFSLERALSISGDVYPEWCLEFFSMMYFDKGVDRTKLMTEKCIWFRHYGIEKVLTLPEFAFVGIYKIES